tara:strand:+ start:432 stop:704 length:273 start_codon:yes stop_codon:yes gene_type:complete
MSVTKKQLNLQVKHLNELLENINPLYNIDLDLTIDYGNGLPSLRSHNGTINIITAMSKPELESAMSGIKHILFGIGLYGMEQANQINQQI